jgi:hypothetical protein
MENYGDNFIKLTSISSKPGNKKLRMRIRTRYIISYAEADDSFISIGAASVLDITNQGMVVCVESLEDVDELVRAAEQAKI